MNFTDEIMNDEMLDIEDLELAAEEEIFNENTCCLWCDKEIKNSSSQYCSERCLTADESSISNLLENDDWEEHLYDVYCMS